MIADGSAVDAATRDFLVKMLTEMPEILYLKDIRTRRYLFINEHSKNTYFGGRDPVGKTVEDMFPASFAKLLTRSDDRLIETGDPIIIDDTLGLARVRITKFLLRDEHGAPLALVGRGIDITDLRNAQSASEEKTRFIARAAHDLRQQMQAMEFFMDAHARSLPPDDRDLAFGFGNLRRSLDTMSRMFESLLDLSRLQNGAFPIFRERFDLAEIMQSVVAGTRRAGDAKGVEIVNHIPSVEVYSDRVLLSRILNNLCANAVRYTDVGRVDLSCEISGDTVAVAIKDTGIGIEPENIPKIWDEAFRVRREGEAGLGIGLSVVHGLARLLGHRIAVTSTPGIGTTFILEIARG